MLGQHRKRASKNRLKALAAATAICTVAGGAAVFAEAASAQSSYNGTVSNNGSGVVVRDYTGQGAPGAGLASLGTLPDGAQVNVQCYVVGDPVSGPNGLGAGGIDEYWDRITAASVGIPQIPLGDTAVVPDAYINTSTPVNEIVPNCDPVAGNGSGGGSSDNGTVRNNGGGTSVYGYTGKTAPGTGLASLGTLSDGTGVHVQCYRIGDPVTGPNGLGAGGIDEYWDQIDSASAGMPQVPSGDTAVVPDAYVQTSTPVNEIVPSCDPGLPARTPGGAGQPAPTGSGTGQPAPTETGGGVSGNAAPAPSGCPDIEVVFARGTNEAAKGVNGASGLGLAGDPFVSSLTEMVKTRLPGKTVSAYAVNFTADWSQFHTIDGANDLKSHVEAMAAKCPSTTFVLGGYSQGAAVLDTAIGLGPDLGSAYGEAGLAVSHVLGVDILAAPALILGSLIAFQQGLPPSLSGRVAAVVTFGNPLGWAGKTIATSGTVYGPKAVDFCNPGDIVCNNPPFNSGIQPHLAYGTDGSVTRGADFVLSMLLRG